MKRFPVARRVVRVGLACVFWAGYVISYAQNNWLWRNPLPAGNTLNAIAGNDTILVAASDAGTILISFDSGVTWASKAVGVPSFGGHEVVYSNNKIYVLQDFTALETSSDFGNSWTFQELKPGSALLYKQPIYGMTRKGSQIVVVGGGGGIFSSPDGGTTWVEDSSPTSSAFYSIMWTGSQYMAFGANGAIVTSMDGINWTAPADSGVGGVSFASAAKSGSLFAAVGSDVLGNAAIVTSPDGVVWTKVNLSSLKLTASVFTRIIWTGTQFIVTGNPGALLTSPNGVTWTALNPPGSGADFNGVVKTASGLFIVGSDGTIIASGKETTWTERDSSITTSDINDLVWTGSRFVAVGENGQTLSSNNGISWMVRDTGTSASLQKIIWTGSRFMAVGAGGTITVSSDGLTWTAENSGDSLYDLNGLAWTGALKDTLYVAVGEGGTIITSPDGETWTSRNSGVSANLWGVAWTDSGFIAVGDNETALASPDGISWSPITVPTPFEMSFNAVVSNGRTTVIVGGLSGVFTSRDGKNWVQAYYDFSGGSLQDVCWTGTQFVAVGTGGTVLASKPDSETVFSAATNPIFSGCSQDFSGIAAMSGNQLVAVGSLGTIMTSGVTSGVRNPLRKKTLPSIFCRVADRKIFFSLPASSKVTARLINLSGKVVMTMADRVYNAGSHVIDLRPYKFSRGLYRLQLLTAHGEAEAPVVIVR